MKPDELKLICDEKYKICEEKHKNVDQQLEGHEKWLSKLDNRIFYILIASVMQLISAILILLVNLIGKK